MNLQIPLQILSLYYLEKTLQESTFIINLKIKLLLKNRLTPSLQRYGQKKLQKSQFPRQTPRHPKQNVHHQQEMYCLP